MILVDTSVWVDHLRHLRASASLTGQVRLWSRDRRLATTAAELHLAYA